MAANGNWKSPGIFHRSGLFSLMENGGRLLEGIPPLEEIHEIFIGIPRVLLSHLQQPEAGRDPPGGIHPECVPDQF